jgi:uncharacterized RDD family membrane protein YckC
LSTHTGQAELSTLWKHEVSQRVAAHRRRKGAQGNDAESSASSNTGGSARSSAAAARVAARYAAAPSYSDLFAAETSAAANALELPAEQIMLLDLGPASAEATSVGAPSQAPSSHSFFGHAPSTEEASFLVTPVEEPQAAMAEATTMAKPDWEQGWDFGNDLVVPAQHPLSEALERASQRANCAVDQPVAEMTIAQAEAPARTGIEKELHASWGAPMGSFEVEAPEDFLRDAQPIHGNLIEFPHELIAARKVRPRRAEGIYALVESEPQLSIFEVDPASVSIQPDTVEQHAETSTWAGPEWADMKLEASRRQEIAPEPVFEEPQDKAVALQAAPMNLRLLAALVDFGVVSIAFLTVALLVVVNAAVLPSLREAEIWGGVVFAAIAVAYLAISYTLARATPGMKYALLSLRTFDGQTPTREQRCRRLGALALSMLPIGLGAVWALFDEDHLSWHDRWSGTYLIRV